LQPDRLLEKILRDPHQGQPQHDSFFLGFSLVTFVIFEKAIFQGEFAIFLLAEPVQL
jgi:hypothetical protein